MLLARGQATITTQTETYTITQSAGNYIFPAASDGEIITAVSVTTKIQVTQGDAPVDSFLIGHIVPAAGFSAVVVDQTEKCVTFQIAAHTTTLADQGKVDIPILIGGMSYHLSFVWSKAKAGAAGKDTVLLDWVKEWDAGRTQIGSNTIITPKLFAGAQNADGTLTGTAVGRYVVASRAAAGSLISETVDGICCFQDGYKTFFLDSCGNAQIGRGNQYIRYDATKGQIEFGDQVSLQWAGATYIDKEGIFSGKLSASTLQAIQIHAAQVTAGVIDTARINVESIRASILTAANIEALELNVIQGRIGGWEISPTCIYSGTKKDITGTFSDNLGDITIGHCGIRGHKWLFDATGSGAIAGGNIRWDQTGNVSFSDSVRAHWQGGIDACSELARAMAFGKMLHRAPEFLLNGLPHYNDTGIYLNKITRSLVQLAGCPNSTGYALRMVAAGFGADDNRVGGFYFGDMSRANAIYVVRLIACIPVGWNIQIYHNNYGKRGASHWLTPQKGTDEWEEYICKVTCGAEGVFSRINYFCLSGGPAPTSETPLTWHVAYATVFDTTACEKYTTTLDANGIYTGTLTAAQVNAVTIDAGSITTGVLSAERLAAASIKAEKLDAASIKASLVNAEYINALSCTFVRGKIGGWTIGTDNITAGRVGVVGETPMQIRTEPAGSGFWYDGSYRPYGIALTWHQAENAGHIILGQIAATSSTVRHGFIGLQMLSHDDAEYFCLSANALHGSKEVYNRIAGWAFDDSHIWKNSVSLGADGSICNSSAWRLNNDGSGQIANGDISWSASGVVSFGPAVSLAWTAPIDRITDALGGNSFPRLTHISSSGIYTGRVYADQIAVNSTLVVGGSTYSGSISVCDANNKVQVTLDRSGIRAVGGTIGGWTINASQIYSGPVILASDGSITNNTRWRFHTDGSGQLAGGNLRWDAAGNLKALGGNFKDVTIEGTIRSAFVLNDPKIWIEGDDDAQTDPRHYDNVVVKQTGVLFENINLPWTLDQSGRRLCLVNYKWGSVISKGYMQLRAPTGKFFYENGIASSTLSFSREVVELLGYGDNATFFGWIVINRRDMMCEKMYGQYQKVLAQGYVTCTSISGATIKYTTFDGSSMSVSKSGTGNFYIYMPWSLGADNYMVMLSGRFSVVEDTPIYASIRNQYSSYFQVSTQDDSSLNDGSFNFQILSTADFK